MIVHPCHPSILKCSRIPCSVVTIVQAVFLDDAAVSPESVDQIVFSNTGEVVQQICLDNVQLLDGNAIS